MRNPPHQGWAEHHPQALGKLFRNHLNIDRMVAEGLREVALEAVFGDVAGHAEHYSAIVTHCGCGPAGATLSAEHEIH